MNAKKIIVSLGGPTKLAVELGLTRQSVWEWGENGRIPKGWLSYLKLKHPELFHKGKK